MSDNTAIGWCTATWNPVTGCTRVNSDCDSCYAVSLSYRLERMHQKKYTGLTVLNAKGDRHFNGVVREWPDALDLPLKWKKPRRVFVNSMSDLFHEGVSFDFVVRVMSVIAQCPQHHFTILTKRPKHAATFFRIYELPPPPNLELGTSAGTQEHLDQMLPHLLNCPVAMRSLSLEPLRGPIGLIDMLSVVDEWRVRQVYVGCESKRSKLGRPCELKWVESIVYECQHDNVPVFVKQIGVNGKLLRREPGEPWPDAWPESLRVQELAEVTR